MMRAFQFLLSVPAVLRQLISNHFVEVFLGNDGHAQLEGFVPLGASSVACQEEGCGFGDGSGGLSSVGGDKGISRQPDCEVILATGSDVEGEATATYLHHLLKEMDCRISRPAQGLPAGSGLSHADTLTLMKALEGRTRL